MNFPISPLIDLSNSILAFFCAVKLYQAYKRNPLNKVIEYFCKVYMMMVTAYLFFSLPRIIVPDNSFYLAVGLVIAQIFLFLAIAYLAMVTTFFIDPLRYKISFWLVITLAIVVVMLSIIYFSFPEYDKITGITKWNIDPVVGIASFVLFLSVLIPSTLFFFYQGVKTRDKIVRIRSILISLGFVLLMITAYTFYQAKTLTEALISNVFPLSSFLIIFFGVYYKRGYTLKTT